MMPKIQNILLPKSKVVIPHFGVATLNEHGVSPELSNEVVADMLTCPGWTVYTEPAPSKQDDKKNDKSAA